MSGVPAWWARTGPVKRVVLVVVVLVGGLNVVLAGFDAVVGSDPGGPSGSTFATGDDGTAAWADLLELRGVRVTRIQEPLADASLHPATTLVVVDPPDAAPAASLRAVADHVARGGRLVAVGAGASDHVAAAVGHDPGWTEEGPTRAQALADAPETTGVEQLSGGGRGRYRTTTRFTPLVGGSGEVTAMARGGVVAVADASLLSNRHLGDADAAAFALALVGDGPVAFAEAQHGYGRVEGISALPVRWRRAAVGLAGAALLAMWCAGQRLGPPERTARTLAPPRRAYVDALAAALSRTARPSRTGRDPRRSGDADRDQFDRPSWRRRDR
ncbi:DUF4350 domain-containing protein [Iamia sp.]|uniref:DUF4350 domain-containing protein n=1 Tax=Iamia sp. TaxID=2722710 RepID=UPI002C9006C4|nr:DUF4350 domain-containing protein [Iamia sp.]HXH56670.1 DUF4350 domain-containing protein [Iamia sp.]